MTLLNSVTPSAPGTTLGRDPWLKSVRATGSWLPTKRTRVAIRGFEFLTDQPEVKGGQNQAPTPMEFIAGAVNACITVTIEAVAAESGIHIEQIDTLTRAHIDVRGFNGTADVSPHFADYTLVVQVVTPAAEDALAELRRSTEKRCPALTLLRDAGVAVDLQWQFSPETFAPLSDDRNHS